MSTDYGLKQYLVVHSRLICTYFVVHSRLTTINLFWYYKKLTANRKMTTQNLYDDDSSSIITDVQVSATGSLSAIRESPKEISDLKRAQLTSAREKAVISRKRKQAVSLETRLHEVRSLLGEVSPGQADRILDVIQEQALHARQEQKKLVDYFINLLQKLSTFNAEHGASVKRSVERLRMDVSELKKSVFSRNCIALSEVSSASSTFKR